MGDTILAALDQAAAALIDGLKAVEDARQQLRKGSPNGGPRANLKPAPFFIPPQAIGSVIMQSQLPRRGIAQVPVVSVELVDRPRRSADPQLAKANDDSATNVPNEIHPDIWEAFVQFYQLPQRWSPSYCRDLCKPLAEDLGIGLPNLAALNRKIAKEQLQRGTGPAFSGSEPARKEDAIYRANNDRDARELENAVDQRISKADRLAIIRDTARKVQQPVLSAPARPVPGVRAERKPVALPVLAAELRGQRLAAAIAFLKREAILVTVVDRTSLIRKYRVSGKRHEHLADEVVQVAIERGFEVPA